MAVEKRVSALLLACIFFCLGAAEKTGIPVDEANVQREARAMNEEKAKLLEEYLAETPDDPLQRSILAVYYFSAAHKDRSLRPRKIRNILWMIEHCPRLEIMGNPAFAINPILDGRNDYEKGATLWRSHVRSHDKDAVVAANAAAYFLGPDRTEAERCLLRARELAPGKADYAWRLARLYFQPADVLGGIERESAEKALKQFLDGYRLADMTNRCRYLPDIVKAAWYSGDFKVLETLASDMRQILGSNPRGYQGSLIFWSNTAEGMLAIGRGDVKAAAASLLKSAETPGTSKLNSFGPNMLLAQAVLERGDSGSVLKFFTLCERFWATGKKQMARWSRDIRAGGKPNFGAHLYY